MTKNPPVVSEVRRLPRVARWRKFTSLKASRSFISWVDDHLLELMMVAGAILIVVVALYVLSYYELPDWRPL